MLPRIGREVASGAPTDKHVSAAPGEPSTLDAALLAALRPSSLRERASLALSGGWSAIQVLDRLAPELRAALEAGAPSPALGRRAAVDAVAARLRALEAAGRLRRGRATLATDVRVKGVRLIEVDVFRLP